MIIKPGRPFWTGFTAFVSSMASLYGVEAAHITQADVQVNIGGALMVSLLISAVVYGKEKIASLNGNKRP
jgi:hypothetical protein